MKKIALVVLGVLLLGMAIPQTGAAPVKSTERSNSLAMLSYYYYRNYNALLPKFNSTYQKAVELGVDNETLSKAMELYNNATFLMEKAVQLSPGNNILAGIGSYRVLRLVRNAYIYLVEALRVLEEAIQAKTVNGTAH